MSCSAFSQEDGTLELLFCWDPGDQDLSIRSGMTEQKPFIKKGGNSMKKAR